MRKEGQKRRYPNLTERTALRAAEIATFVKKIGRRAPKGCEPNDRAFDREVEQRVRRMNPTELDKLLREDEL